MRTRTLLCALALAALVAAGAAPAASPPIAISATPTLLTLTGGAQGSIHVVDPGRQPITIDVSVGNFAVAPNGRVEVDPREPPNRAAKSWISVSPLRLHLAAGAGADLTVRTHPPRQAEPGDHNALVLLTGHASGTGTVGVRTRLGIGVLVRMPGAIERKLAIDGIHVVAHGRTRILRVVVANRGNLNERLRRGDVTVTLRRNSHAFATLHGPPLELLPGDRVVATLRYRGRESGRVTALVRLRPESARVEGPRAPELPPLARRFSVRL